MKIGAWPQDKGVQFRVWAPKVKSVDVVITDDNAVFPMTREDDGYFSAHIADLTPGAHYKYRIDGGQDYPDPCSRFQPQGPHGPSMVTDPNSFSWTDHAWQQRGITLKGQVIYELHVGAFSPQGTYAGISQELEALKALGITVIELMPIAECPGRWNWGYDGVDLFAPAHAYGSPDELKALINRAHEMGMAVILDVVYNHIGPDGNYLRIYSDAYFTDRYENDWGEAINFDGDDAKGVRNFFLQNALYWINEFHLDGLRLDATQNIEDRGSPHILEEMSVLLRSSASPKKIILIGENESQHVKLIVPVEHGGYGLDALWNDDFHHSARVAATGLREAYYTDYLGRPEELIASIKYGYLYQGQYYSWQKNVRGSFVTEDIHACQFVLYLQNHDQISNSLYGQRFLWGTADQGISRALTALLLLAPGTPMIFMGQEFGASSPFLFFTDHNADLAKAVYEGRKKFLSQFPSYGAALQEVPDPNQESTFRMSHLKWEERRSNAHIYRLHADLLALRRNDAVFRLQKRNHVDGAVIGRDAFVLRYKGNKKEDRLLIVNLGPDMRFDPCPEPLLAPLTGCTWELIWAADDPLYGGRGVRSALQNNIWNIPGHTAQVFAAKGGPHG